MKILKSFVCIASTFDVPLLSAAKPDANELPRNPSLKVAGVDVVLPNDAKAVKPKSRLSLV